MDRYDFADGKYTVINDNGKLTALRHGEPWERDLVGDNLVYWMLVEVLRLKADLDAKVETTSTTIPHSLAGFRGAFESEHGRRPTEQEVWDAGIRSWRDLAAPTTWQDLPDNVIDFTPGQEDFELTDDEGFKYSVQFYMEPRHMDVGDLP